MMKSKSTQLYKEFLSNTKRFISQIPTDKLIKKIGDRLIY